jgi:hypothetical protein
MSDLAYEALGRITWAVGKRRARNYFKVSSSHHFGRITGGAFVLVVGAVVAAELAARASFSND